MILLVDIGNTTIAIAAMKKGKIQKAGRIETKKNKKISFYKKAFGDYFRKNKINKTEIDLVLFCSVVPSLNSNFKKTLKNLLSAKVLEAGKDIKFTVKNRYRNPSEVGADRLSNAVAASYYYSNKDVIIVDFGTAITFDIVNKKGEYLGGLIIPGLSASLKSLSKEAELLPEISLKKASGLIGKDTITSINNGIVYATAFACDGIIKRLKKKLSPNTIVLATGGYADLIKKYTLLIHKIDPNLTLKGLYVNYSKRGKERKKQ